MSDNVIENVSEILARLPSLGKRSSKRVILDLLEKKDEKLLPLITALKALAEQVEVCKICGNFSDSNPCDICQDPKKDIGTLCIVENVAELWAMQRAAVYSGKYHVLGGLLSPINGITPADLNTANLNARIEAEKINEVIFALPATVEGRTTMHYIKDLLKNSSVKITEIAHGVPFGGELDYLDEGTIAEAFRSRKVSE